MAPIFINKEVGETPLEALEKHRASPIAQGRIEFIGVPMTYAGRLDPMAEGALLILVGDECKQKEKYLGLDKEYEIEIVFGIETDTYDALGLADLSNARPLTHDLDFNKYVGKFAQEYPAYSSKTVNGKQLHGLARSGDLPDEMPTKDVEIYEIAKIGERTIDSSALLKEIQENISKVKGDFRQSEIMARWKDTLQDAAQLEVAKIRVKCSSGTYMRSLAHRIGKDAEIGAFALSIKRTKIIL